MKWVAKQKLTGFLFTAPALIIMGIFVFYPIIKAMNISFYSWDLLGPRQYRGVENYARLVTSASFHKVLYRTFEFVAITVVPNLVLGLFLAIILNQALRLRNLWRAIIFLPAVTSMVAIGQLWKYMYAEYGAINYLLSFLGISSVRWLSDPSFALISVGIAFIWYQVGWNVVLFLAGLQSIPLIYYEAAKIDGASPWNCFRSITLPLLKPITVFILVVTMIGGFRVFALIYVMTGGGPGTSTMVMMMYVYHRAFMMSKMGQSSAIAMILFTIVLTLSIIQLKLFRSAPD